MKSSMFFAGPVGYKISLFFFFFFLFHHNMWLSYTIYTNVQVTIIFTWLNFAGIGLQILCLTMSNGLQSDPSRKITLNFNREVNYRELAKRPWFGFTITSMMLSQDSWWKWWLQIWGEHLIYICVVIIKQKSMGKDTFFTHCLRPRSISCLFGGKRVNFKQPLLFCYLFLLM